MFIAEQKRKENITEYLLYIWQIEDLIRACHLDMSLIRQQLIPKYGLNDEAQISRLADWYENLLLMMKEQHLEEKGHMQITRLLMGDVYNFHLHLLTLETEIPYQNAFKDAWTDLEVLQKKIPGGEKMHHVELALTAIYDYYLLKLQGKMVMADTKNAVMRISRFMAALSAKYLKAEEDLKK